MIEETLTKEQVINRLIQIDLDELNTEDFANILRKGHRGYLEMSDEELISTYLDQQNDNDLITFDF